MKPRYFNKKLLLNKKTVAHLETGEMEVVRGGETELFCTLTCEPCVYTKDPSNQPHICCY